MKTAKSCVHLREEVVAMKKFTKYLPRIIYIIIGLLLLILFNYIYEQNRIYRMEKYMLILPIVLSMAVCFLIGVYLGCDFLLRGKNKFHITWYRLITGIALLILSILINLPFSTDLYRCADKFYFLTTISGYFIATCFTKSKENV